MVSFVGWGQAGCLHPGRRGAAKQRRGCRGYATGSPGTSQQRVNSSYNFTRTVCRLTQRKSGACQTSAVEDGRGGHNANQSDNPQGVNLRRVTCTCYSITLSRSSFAKRHWRNGLYHSFSGPIGPTAAGAQSLVFRPRALLSIDSSVIIDGPHSLHIQRTSAWQSLTQVEIPETATYLTR